MNTAAQRVLRETLDANDKLLTVSQFFGVASTLDDPDPARVTHCERAMTSLGGQTDLRLHGEQTRRICRLVRQICSDRRPSRWHGQRQQ